MSVNNKIEYSRGPEGELITKSSPPSSFIDTVDLKTNLSIIARERGKIVQRYEAHNVFLNYGRAWLLDLISYANTGYSNTVIPVAPVSADRRVRYIGFGIGGVGQVASIPVGVSGTYPGTNTYTDTDETITDLERPVLVTTTWGVSYEWEQEVTHASTVWNTSPYYVKYLASFDTTDLTISGAPGPFAYLPLSEIGLYENSCDPTEDYTTVRYASPSVRPNPICYHTFYTISKTSLITMDVYWEIRLP